MNCNACNIMRWTPDLIAHHAELLAGPNNKDPYVCCAKCHPRLSAYLNRNYTKPKPATRRKK